MDEREGERDTRVTTAARLNLAQRLFATRIAGCFALAGACAAVPALGPHRFAIGASVLLIVLPYNVVLAWWSGRHGRLPVLLAYGDHVFAAAYLGLAPTTWVPVLLLLTGDIGLATAAFGRQRAMRALVLGLAILTAGSIVGGVESPAIGILGYLIAGVMLIVTVGSLFDGEHLLLVRHERLLEDVDAIVWEATIDPCHFTFVSRHAVDILGYEVRDWLEDGFWHNHIHPADRERVFEHDAAAIDAGLDHTLEYRMLHADGRVVHLRDMVTVVCDPSGQPVSVRGVMVDITDQRAAEEQVRQYASMVERIQMALMVAQLPDADDPSSFVIIAANPTACALAERPLEAVVGHRAVEVFPGIDQVGLPQVMAGVVRTGEAVDLDNVVSPEDPEQRHYALHVFRLGDDTVGVSVDDVTAPSLAVAALRQQATHDALTGLPNRVLLKDRLHQALLFGERNGTPVALLVMDLDQFKEINDALGHHHGDRLLIALSRRLEDVLRDADTIARLGGDEFAILLTTDATRTGAVTVARKVMTALEQPFEIDGLSLQTNASIGIALSPEHGTDGESLTKRADVAMYIAKRSSNGFAVYASEHDRSSVRRITLLGELRKAIELDELVLYHQPTYDLRSGEIVGTEALLRWQHPQHGLMLPVEFIDLAEVSGLIQQLTRFAIERAITTASTWPAARGPLSVSVNLSVRNLYDPDLPRWMGRLLRDTSFPASRLILELTESQVMDDPNLAVEVLAELQRLGVKTSIDDFGTGQSSLAYLKHLPIDELKIDRSFVAGMRESGSGATIVKSIIELAHNLGLTVVAEGVEDEATLRQLVDFDCDRAQGFHLGRPLSAAELLRALHEEDAWLDPTS